MYLSYVCFVMFFFACLCMLDDALIERDLSSDGEEQSHQEEEEEEDEVVCGASLRV